jgi:restriction system protein
MGLDSSHNSKVLGTSFRSATATASPSLIRCARYDNMKKRGKSEFLKWMGPLLDALRDLGDSATPQEASDWVANACGVSDEKKEELLESGTPRFHNQVCWARQYLVWEGLLGSAQRGIWTLTEKGKTTHLSLEDATEIFRKWVAIHAERRKQQQKKKEAELSPDDVDKDDSAYDADDHADELLSILQKLTPNGFERFSKFLLRVYGFERVEVTPMGKDGGIDGFGVLQVNPFVSFKVIFQCKRYKGTVSRAQVGDLRNAMLGRADKGIMITTGIFSEDAKREAVRDGAPAIELIDGTQLVDMLEKEGIGVKQKTVYEIDNDFFRPYLSD